MMDINCLSKSSCDAIPRPKTLVFQQSHLKLIKNKMIKVKQYKMIENSKNDLYWKLAEKLQQELKKIKNHNTSEARQKLILLEKCRNQKHIRRKTKNTQQNRSPEFFQQNIYPYRPVSCCSLFKRNKNAKKVQDNDSSLRQDDSKENSFNAKQYESACKKLYKIKKICQNQYQKTQKLKQQLNVVQFYQKLIYKNSSKIFTKML